MSSEETRHVSSSSANASNSNTPFQTDSPTESRAQEPLIKCDSFANDSVEGKSHNSNQPITTKAVTDSLENGGNVDIDHLSLTQHAPSTTSKGKHLHLSNEESLSSRQRRSSSRSIKRKRFDDELVESSILTPKAQRNRTLSTSLTPTTLPGSAVSSACGSPSPVVNLPSSNKPTPSTIAPPTNESTPLQSQSNLPTTSTPQTTSNSPVPGSSGLKSKACFTSVPSIDSSIKKPAPKSVSGSTINRRRLRIAHNNAVKDLGRWKPQDDLALVLSVQQTNDLEQVYRGVKFSSKFSLQEIEQRWYVLLYDPTIAKIGVAAMRQLHPDVIAQIYSKTPFSQEEEGLLKAIPVANRPTIETFQELLEKHIDVFAQYRTAKTLKAHWTLLKHYQLLNDQTVTSTPTTPITSVTEGRCEEMQNFSDMEENVERELIASLSNPSSLFRSEEAINQELMLSNRKCIREIRQLENEIPRWQVLVDSITGVAPSDFDSETLAVLRGRLVRYLMRSREITLGRCTRDSLVDVDLSLEGPSDKISRKQALIKLTANGEFVITNVGKRPFHVDSKPVLGNLSCAKLFNNSVVEIAGLRFVFLVNQELIAAVRAEALKSHM